MTPGAWQTFYNMPQVSISYRNGNPGAGAETVQIGPKVAGDEAATPAQLHLQPGQVVAMATPDDRVVQGVYGAKVLAPAIPIVGPYLNDVLGDFGPNPATNPTFTRLETGATTITEPGGATMVLQDAHGHSEYPRFPDGGGLRTTNYNIAAVIAGTTPIEDK